MSLAAPLEPQGRKPARFDLARFGVYATLALAALAITAPLYIMLVTSLKTMPEIRSGTIIDLPKSLDFSAWTKAWSTACTGLNCNGIRVGFWNSVTIMVPSVICSIAVGALNGYALAFWKVRGAGVLFALMLVGAFIPYPVFIAPLVQILRWMGLYFTGPGQKNN